MMAIPTNHITLSSGQVSAAAQYVAKGHIRTQALQQDALVFGFALEAMAAGSMQ